MPQPIYYNVIEPVDVTQKEPPKPVESSHSKPQRVAKMAVSHTLYAFGSLFVDPEHIPASLRSTRAPKHTAANSPTTGRTPQFGSSQIVRTIPDSYSDSMSQ